MGRWSIQTLPRIPYWQEWLTTTFLNDLDASLVRRVDEVLVGRVRRLQPRIDPGPVVAVVTVIVQPAAVLDRRGDPDSGEAQVLEVVQLLDQPFEVAPPVRVRRTAVGVEGDPVSAVEVVRRITVVEPGGDEEVDGLLTEVHPGRRGLRGGCPCRRGCRAGRCGGTSGSGVGVLPLAIAIHPAVPLPTKVGRLPPVLVVEHQACGVHALDEADVPAVPVRLHRDSRPARGGLRRVGAPDVNMNGIGPSAWRVEPDR